VGSILLVPSDPDTSERWGTAIRQAGHHVLLALTWRDAYRRVLQGGIDAVVVDSFDPRIGVEQLARSMARRPDAPPIVLVSTSPAAAAVSARIGATAFLPKPCETRALIEIVNRLADASPANDDFKDDVPTEQLVLTS
jgi:DNA-binding NtrC family response regulator